MENQPLCIKLYIKKKKYKFKLTDFLEDGNYLNYRLNEVFKFIDDDTYRNVVIDLDIISYDRRYITAITVILNIIDNL